MGVWHLRCSCRKDTSDVVVVAGKTRMGIEIRLSLSEPFHVARAMVPPAVGPGRPRAQRMTPPRRVAARRAVSGSATSAARAAPVAHASGGGVPARRQARRAGLLAAAARRGQSAALRLAFLFFFLVVLVAGPGGGLLIDAALGELTELAIGRLLLLQRLGEDLDDVGFPEQLRPRENRPVGADLVVFGPLGARNDA